jgi:glycosyltransferase involved in cell wall biosynthesis
MDIFAIGQGVTRAAFGSAGTVYLRNKGFAWGMNKAIQEGISIFGRPDYVLCFNNDLQFPDKDWLRILLRAAPAGRITVPATDMTAIYTQPKPLNKNPFDIQEMSAYCWLVPFEWCEFLKKTYGWWLFDTGFFAFGEDNKTAWLLSKEFGPHVFRVVPRSWVRHLRHQTTSVVKHDRRESSRRLKQFFEAELGKPDLRSDLRKWAKRYVKKLKT